MDSEWVFFHFDTESTPTRRKEEGQPLEFPACAALRTRALPPGTHALLRRTLRKRRSHSNYVSLRVETEVMGRKLVLVLESRRIPPDDPDKSTDITKLHTIS